MRSLGSLALICIMALAAYFAASTYLRNMSASKSKSEQIFVVKAGDNFSVVANRLQKQGLIRSARSFRWLVNFIEKNQILKRGEYQIRPNMSNLEILKILNSGQSRSFKVTIPEGHNLFQVASRLAQAGFGKEAEFIRLARSREFIENIKIPTLPAGESLDSLEGYLYPDTYFLNRFMSEKEILRKLVSRFAEVYKKIDDKVRNTPHLRELKINPHETVVLASMVEKETGAGFERPMIASVFLNRLKIRKRLESDPTTIYGMWSRDGFFKGNIRKSDLLEKTPYNTYKIRRLPKGPIANPGIDALQAILEPKTTEFLYFVSRNDGTHVFTKNFKDHKVAVRKYQKNPRARRGKSWRQLPKELRANN